MQDLWFCQADLVKVKRFLNLLTGTGANFMSVLYVVSVFISGSVTNARLRGLSDSIASSPFLPVKCDRLLDTCGAGP